MPSEDIWTDSSIHRLILQAMDDYAVLGIDKTGIVRLYTPGAQKILGYSPEEIVGKGSYIVFTREDYMSATSEMEMLTANRNGKALDERWHVRKGGQRFWAVGMMYALRNDEGEHVGYLKIFRDMSAHQPPLEPATGGAERY